MNDSTTSAKSKSQAMGLIDPAARKLLFRQMASLKRGQITLESADETSQLGESSDLQTTLRIAHFQPGTSRETM